jgi:membrane-associated phospholipid phosphatase
VPSPATLQRRATWLAGAAALALAVLSILAATRSAVLMHPDAVMSAAAGRFTESHAAVRSATAAVTHSADPLELQVLLVASLITLAALRRWRAVLYVAAVALTGTAVRLALLHLIARPRPSNRLIESTGYSFPSGHTTSSALAAGAAIVALFPLLPPAWPRRALAAVAITWAALVGLSRILLLAHWPSDVLAGWLLATAVVLALLPIMYGSTAFLRSTRDTAVSDGMLR